MKPSDDDICTCKLNVDYYLSQICGFGRFHGIMTFIGWCVLMGVSINVYSPVFTSINREYYCDADVLNDNVTAVIHQCDSNCSRWTFNQSLYHTTIQSQYSLVCDKEKMAILVISVFSFGMMTGGLITGSLSDRFGRILMVKVSTLLLFLVDVGLLVAPFFVLHLVLRFFGGILGVTLYSCIVTYTNEVTPFEKREITSGISATSFTAANLMMCGVAFLLKNHYHLQECIAAVVFASFLMSLWMPESPSWYNSRDRYKDALKSLRFIYKVNHPNESTFDHHFQNFEETFLPTTGSLLRQNSMKESPALQESSKNVPIENNNNNENGNESKNVVLVLIEYISIIRSMLCLMVAAFSSGLTYFGVTYGVQHLQGNIFVTFAWMATVSLVAESCLPLFLRLMGRRLLICSFSVVQALLLLTSGILENLGHQDVVTVLCVLSRPMSAICYSSSLIYISELMPTSIRNSAVSGMILTAYLSSAVAPFLVTAENANMSYFVISGSLLFSFLLVSILPETCGATMPHSFAETVKLNRLENGGLGWLKRRKNKRIDSSSDEKVEI